MQERKVVVTRILKSGRLFPEAKETPEERIRRFVDAQKQVVAYPFSPDISVKALGSSGKNPAADNKDKRKKAKSKFKRLGVGIFDPDAKAKPGQYFEIRPRRINQDGQLGDVPNMGWLDPRKSVKPKDLVAYGKKQIQKQKQNIQVRVVSAKKNKRTGGIEAKALGRSIGQTVGNIGQAAARAIGIVVDADGKFRCPPGVPAANQFTDEVGSNCFDFSPAIGRALVRIAQRYGFNLQDSIRRIDAATPFERDKDGTLRRGASLRSSGLILPGAPSRPSSDGIIYGPDGKPLATRTPVDPEVAEFEVAEETLRTIAAGTGEIVDPDTYEEEFRKALRKAYPELSDAEIDEMAKVAAQREKLKDEVRKQQRESLQILRDMGIDFDENDPNSVQEAISFALWKMRSDGWDIDLEGYYGEGFHDNPMVAILAHRRMLAELGYDGLEAAVEQGKIEGLDADTLDKLKKKYGSRFREVILQAMQDGTPVSDLFPDDEDAQNFAAMAKLAYSKAQAYEVGTMMQLVRQRKLTPDMVGEISGIYHSEFDPYDPFFADTSVDGRTGKITLSINIAGMLVTHPPKSLSDSGFHLYEPSGTAGTEIAKLQAIGDVVSAENRARLLGSYLGELGSFAQEVQRVKEQKEAMTKPLGELGGMSHGLFVMYHELMHARQLQIIAKFIQSRDPGMTNAEALDWAVRIGIGGESFTDAYGREFNIATILSSPEVLSTAVGDVGEILATLVDQKIGGNYGPGHYYQAINMNYIASASSLGEMERRYEELRRKAAILEVTKPGSAELDGIKMALNKTVRLLEDAQEDGWEETRFMRNGARSASAIAIMEMQADIAAAVEMGMIEKTPEVEALISPLSRGKDLDAVVDTIVPEVAVVETRTQKLKRVAKAARKISRDDIRQIIEDSQRLGRILDRDASRDESLTSGALRSAASFDGRGAASRWGASVRDAYMSTATPEQKRVIEGKWRNRKWSKPSSDMSIINSLAMGDGDNMANEIENEFIPFVDLIGNSKLPNGVAVELVLPSGTLSPGDSGFPSSGVRGVRYEIGGHHTGLIKSNEDLFSSVPPSPTPSGQRVILNVPEGSSGLPDFTPGSNGSEVGSIILPPGEIELIDVRDDGVAIASLTRQETVSETLSKKKGQLLRVEQRTERLDDKIAIRKALNRIERKEQVEQRRSLRSSGVGNVAQPKPNTRVPSEPDARTVAIKDRMESQGIQFGKPLLKRIAELREKYEAKLNSRNNSGGIVSDDTHDFESPEAAKKRVDKAIDNAIAQIKAGTLPGLSPEVAEIMKDKSPEEIRQILVTTLRKHVDGLDKRARFRIRGAHVYGVRDGQDSPLMGFIKTGRWRTTHDTSGSQAASDSKRRKEAELLLGIPETADDDLRPAHGYYLHVDELDFRSRRNAARRQQIADGEGGEDRIPLFNEDNLSHQPNPTVTHDKMVVDPMPHEYGSSEIVLKPEASQRTVITFGDSLNGMRTPIPLDGSATDDELLEAGLLNRASMLDSGMFSVRKTDTTQRRIAALLEASVSQNHERVAVSTDGNSTGRYYVEAIVGGSFTMDDVEEIRIEPDFEAIHGNISQSAVPNEVKGHTAYGLLRDVMPRADIDAVIKILDEPETEENKTLKKNLREIISDRYNLHGRLEGRRRIRADIESRVSDPTKPKPKVTFLDTRGRDFESHSKHPRALEETGMDDTYDIVDVIARSGAVRVRKLLKENNIPVSEDSEFDSMKPKPRTLRSSGSPVNERRTLRSSGSMTIDEIPGSGVSRRLERRTSLRSSGRTTREKLDNGPSELDYGIDDKGLPRVATVEENKQKFGRTPKEVKKYFKDKWGIKVKNGLPDGQKNPEQEAVAYAAMQALDDVMNNMGDVAEILKNENLSVNFNSQWTARDTTMGSFSLNRRVLFHRRKQNMEIAMYPKNVVEIAQKNAQELRANGVRGLINGLRRSRAVGLVADPFVEARIDNVPDADMDLVVAQRLTYANMVHEMGHLLDYLARDGNEQSVRLKPLIPMWLSGAETDIEKRVYQSAQIAETDSLYADKPNVSFYGSSSPQESLAEAWTAWFLFSRRPDIEVKPVGNDGRITPSTQSIAGAAQNALRPLFESLGDGIKTAEQTDDYEETTETPLTVLLYALAPFIIDKEEKK